MHTENQKASAYTAACSKERWSVEDLQYTSEGSLAWACFNAGYDLASAALATPEAGGAGEGEALKLVLTRAAELIANESPTTQGGTSLAPSDRFHALLLALNPYLYNPFEGPAYVIDPAKIPALSATPVGGDVVGGAKTGAELIAAERAEQIHKHGFDVTNDADYGNGELMQAAATCLSLCAKPNMASIIVGGEHNQRKMWPWRSEFGMGFYAKIWAKSDIEQLTVAGALIAAEIDRLQAAAPTPTSQSHA